VELAPLKFLRNLSRGREIVTVLINHGFDDVVEQSGLLRYVQWWRRVILRRRARPAPPLSRPARVRVTFEELGPTFVKFGQVISTRPDLVPANYIAELEKLQERVPAFPGSEARMLLEDQLGRPVRELFAEFDERPLAAGSLGQVHLARHHDGTQLAVKIRRPNVVREIERDLSLMHEIAILAQKHLPEAEIFDPVGLVQQFARTIRREVNFAREGRTLDEFRRLFRDDATLHVPSVFWDLTSEAVLTCEFIDGHKITDVDTLRGMGLSPAEIAANGARIFLKMAFEFGTFHGDPHPGNMRILPSGVIGLFDFGMIGRLEDEKREQLIDLLVAVVHGDSAAAVEQVLLIGKPYRPVDLPLLKSDLRDFVDGYYGLPLEKIDVGHLLSDFVSILSSHGIRYPADLMMLIRVIVTLEGTGRQLDPEFNVAEHLAPVVEQLVRERYNPKRMAGKILDESKALWSVLQKLPVHVGKTLEKLSNDDLRVHIEHQHLDHLITEIDRSSNRVTIGLVMSSLILASALVMRNAGEHAWWIGIPTFILSSLLGVWLIYGVFRSGRP
jgi:ubiquinone biosynthesis protein